MAPPRPRPVAPDRDFEEWSHSQALSGVDAAAIAAAVASTPEPLSTPEADADDMADAANAETFEAMLASIHPGLPFNLVAAGLVAKAHAEATTVEVRGHLCIDEPAGVVGDVVVHGDLVVESAFVVTGNLTVHGVISDCGPDSGVAVLGDVSCKHLATDGAFVVMGHLRAEGAVFGSYNDDSLEVLGGIDAGVLVTDEHDISSGGPLNLRHRPEAAGPWGPDIFNMRSESDVERLVALLGADGFDERDAAFVWPLVRTDF